MIPVIPLAVAGALALFAFAMAKRKEDETPLLPGATPGAPSEAQKTPTGAAPATSASAPAGALPPATTAKSGDTQVVHADDAFDAAVAAAIAKHDVPALRALADQAEKMGLFTVAKSLRDEIARLTEAAPPPTPIKVDKPVLSATPTATLATYIVKAGDTGEKIALAYTGNKSRWTELVTVNPTLKDPKYGLKIYAGQRINIPASWPAGVPVLPAVPPPAVVPPTVVPPVTPSLATYTVLAGDTGEKVAQKFTGDKSRWRELLTVNPTLKSAQYGIALYTGHKINLPSSWPSTAGYAAPITVLAPPPMPQAPPPVALPPAPTPMALPAESDQRAAARELTSYLNSLGGLAGRYKEDQARVKAWQARLGTMADGKYGRGTAGIIIQNGIIPVAPYYWPRVGTQAAKDEFIGLVKNSAAADPMRKAQWDKLLADTIRS